MVKVSPLLVLPLVIFALLAGLFYVGMQRDNPDALPSAIKGNPAPVVEFEPMFGKPAIADADLRTGGVKLVNFWASWCAPCRAEHPNLVALAEQGLTVYGVNYKDDPGNALGFLEELGDPFSAIGVDQTGRQAIEWGVAAVPETFFLDGEGKVILRFAGPITQRALDRDIWPAVRAAQSDN
ncbi:MAG: DsbE family thiol:disulfide interchange protein [Pseudomonadota bacterium]